MSEPLHVLPARDGSAAENMALDFLLLQRYPEASAPRFRHYGWRRAAFTFGYSQRIAFARGRLPPGGAFDLCRRPTGGGIVDHRDDWTYAVVIPRGHPLEDLRATQSYREIHACLAGALREQGIAAELKPAAAAPGGPPIAGVCFERAETFDVVNAATGAKIAGAAQKRNRRGLLLQGSLWRPAAGPGADWERFERAFVARLGAALGAAPESRPWPDLGEDETAALAEHYASPEWLDAR